MKRLIETNRFLATNSEGKRIEVIEATEFIPYRTNTGSGETPGRKSYKTLSGRHLNWIERGRYQVFDTGEILTSDAPNAS